MSKSTETLSLTARLQQAETRAIAAERALADLKAYADDTFTFWDNDKDSKVGKRLMWMSGTGNRDYEPSLKHIHEISTSAARELMRKAACWDNAIESVPVLAHQVMVMRDALNAAATAQAAEEEENVSYECAMHCRIEAEAKLIKALALTPTAALDDLKSRVRREVLEEVAKDFSHENTHWYAYDVAAELRRMAEEGK